MQPLQLAPATGSHAATAIPQPTMSAALAMAPSASPGAAATMASSSAVPTSTGGWGGAAAGGSWARTILTGEAAAAAVAAGASGSLRPLPPFGQRSSTGVGSAGPTASTSAACPSGSTQAAGSTGIARAVALAGAAATLPRQQACGSPPRVARQSELQPQARPPAVLRSASILNEKPPISMTRLPPLDPAAAPPHLRSFGLNGEQLAAATARCDAPLMIVAGAGSGKTATLTARMVHAIVTTPCSARALLCITFTRAAAGEMRARLARYIGEPEARHATISTFHSMGGRLCRKFIDKLRIPGLTRGFVLITDAEQMRLMKGCVEAVDTSFTGLSQGSSGHGSAGTPNRQNASDAAGSKSYKRRLRMRAAAILRQWKVTRLDAYTDRDPLRDMPHDMQPVVAEYRERCCTSNVLDFPDMIRHGIALLRHHADVRAWVARMYLHFFADEWQDTSRAQFELFRLMVTAHIPAAATAGTGSNLRASVGNDSNGASSSSNSSSGGGGGAAYAIRATICGDPDQQIMGFQGAFNGSFHAFAELSSQAALAVLERNYRSTARIVRSSGAVIAEAADRVVAKTCVAHKEEGELVTLAECRTQETEAQFVLTEVLRLHDVENVPFREIALLCRTNKLALQYAHCLRRLGIPYKRAGSNLYKLTDMHRLLSYVRLVAYEDDETALVTLVSVFKWNLATTTQALLEAWCAKAPPGNATAGSGVLSPEEEAELLALMDAPAEDFVPAARPLQPLPDQPAAIAAVAASTALAPAAGAAAPPPPATGMHPIAALRRLVVEHQTWEAAQICARTGTKRKRGKSPGSRKGSNGRAEPAASTASVSGSKVNSRGASRHGSIDDINDDNGEADAGARPRGTSGFASGETQLESPSIADVPAMDVSAIASALSDLDTLRRRANELSLIELMKRIMQKLPFVRVPVDAVDPTLDLEELYAAEDEAAQNPLKVGGEGGIRLPGVDTHAAAGGGALAIFADAPPLVPSLAPSPEPAFSMSSARAFPATAAQAALMVPAPPPPPPRPMASMPAWASQRGAAPAPAASGARALADAQKPEQTTTLYNAMLEEAEVFAATYADDAWPATANGSYGCASDAGASGEGAVGGPADSWASVAAPLGRGIRRLMDFVDHLQSAAADGEPPQSDQLGLDGRSNGSGGGVASARGGRGSHRSSNARKLAHDAVWLGTVHQAKGLEWHAVFVLRMNDGIFPILPRDEFDSMMEAMFGMLPSSSPGLTPVRSSSIHARGSGSATPSPARGGSAAAGGARPDSFGNAGGPGASDAGRGMGTGATRAAGTSEAPRTPIRADMKAKAREVARSSVTDGDAITNSSQSQVVVLSPPRPYTPVRKREKVSIDEERRLTYVAMSRAVQRLYLLYVLEHQRVQVEPSRFLDDIPSVLLRRKYQYDTRQTPTDEPPTLTRHLSAGVAAHAGASGLQRSSSGGMMVGAALAGAQNTSGIAASVAASASVCVRPPAGMASGSAVGHTPSSCGARLGAIHDGSAVSRATTTNCVARRENGAGAQVKLEPPSGART